MNITKIILSKHVDGYSNVGRLYSGKEFVERFNPNNVVDRNRVLLMIQKDTRIIDQRIDEMKFSDFIKDRSSYTKRIVKTFKQSGGVYDPVVQGIVSAIELTGDIDDNFRAKLAFAFGGYVEVEYTRGSLDPYIQGINGYTYIWDRRVFYLN